VCSQKTASKMLREMWKKIQLFILSLLSHKLKFFFFNFALTMGASKVCSQESYNMSEINHSKFSVSIQLD
jgi:hypothetical protein